MPHRRLVRAFAFTIALALVAFFLVAVPARPSPRHFYEGPSTSQIPAIVAATTAAASTTKIEQDDQWNVTAAESAVRETAARTSARRTGRTGTAPAPSGDALEAIAAHFPDVYDSAVRVARCESTLNPGAVSAGGGNWGLFQVNRAAHESDFVQFANALLDGQGIPAEDPRRTFEGGTLNADLNAAYARKLYSGSGGWGPWSCSWAA